MKVRTAIALGNDHATVLDMPQTMPKKKSPWLKVALFFLIGVSVLTAYHLSGVGSYLTLEALKENQELLLLKVAEGPWVTALTFGIFYVIVTAFSFPGASVLTLAAGAVFGLAKGTLIVSFASTIGATLAFLLTRFFFKEATEAKFRSSLESVNRGLEKDGAFYLLTLRLMPLFPFFLVNAVMGLTKVKTSTFFIVSQIGMIPGTLAYVNAGTQVSKIDSLKGILSPELLGSFVVLGLVPIISKMGIDYFRSRKFLRRFKKPKSFDYNMIVIGAGSAGLVSAYIASAVKAKVALIEKHKMGGDCLNTGCVPSKALLRSAKVLSLFKRAEEFGLKTPSLEFDFAKVMERVQNVIREIEPHDSVERYTGLGVDCISGEAKILSPFEVSVNGKTLTTKNIVVATGARPLVPNLPGLSDVKFLTSDTVWNLREKPRRMVVLGGGAIGAELSQAFSRLGVQITMVEMSPRILSKEDTDVSEIMQKKLKKDGVNVLVGHRAVRVRPGVLVCEVGGREVEIEFDQILVALGRKANVSGFGLEALEIELAPNGTIVADSFLRTTNYPNIYVCGDVTGPYQFTHVASHQAWYVAVNALFSPFKKFAVDYRVIPWCTFTDPEVARVGLSEIEAIEKGIEVEVTRYGIDDLDRAIAESEAHGFVKVLTPPGSDRILGATIVGAHAGELLAEYVLAMKHGLGLNKILGTIHSYPTMAEANKFAAGVWRKAHAPQGVLKWVERYHAFRRGGR